MVPAPIGGSLLRNTGIFAAVCVTLMLISVSVSAWRSAGSTAVPFCLPLHTQRIRISQEQEFGRANYLTIAISATGLAMRRSALGGDRYLLRSLVDVFPNIPGGLRDAARARVRREIEAASGLERAGVDRSGLPELRVEDETEFFRSGAIIEVDAATGQLSRVTNEDWDAADPTIFDNNSQLSGSGRLRDELVTRYGGWKVRQLPVAHGGRMQAVATHADGPATGQSLGFDPSAGRIRPFDGDDPATIDGDRIYIQFYEFFDTSPAVTRPLGCLTRCQAVSTMRTRGSFAAIRTPDDKYLLVVSAQQMDDLAGREFEISVSVVKIPEPADATPRPTAMHPRTLAYRVFLAPAAKIRQSARPTAAKPPESCRLSAKSQPGPPPFPTGEVPSLRGGGGGGGRVEPHGEPKPANKDPAPC